MDEEHIYSPIEVCEMFNISKSTLLRWEREGIISSVKRNPNNDQRLYSQDNVRKIGQQLARQLVKQFSRSVESDDIEEAQKAYEALYMWRFFQGEPNSVEALENYPRLSPESIRKLCRIGLERYEPSSPMFHRIARIIAKQSEKLAQPRQ